MSLFNLGIDVAKAKLDCALRFPEGKFKTKAVENSPAGFKTLAEWLAKQGATSAHVCLEATGVYWEYLVRHNESRPDTNFFGQSGHCMLRHCNPAFHYLADIS